MRRSSSDIMYAQGRSTAKDLSSAYAWLYAATAAGDPRGKELLHSVEKTLSKEQAEAALQRSQDSSWRARAVREELSAVMLMKIVDGGALLNLAFRGKTVARVRRPFANDQPPKCESRFRPSVRLLFKFRYTMWLFQPLPVGSNISVGNSKPAALRPFGEFRSDAGGDEDPMAWPSGRNSLPFEDEDDPAG